MTNTTPRSTVAHSLVRSTAPALLAVLLLGAVACGTSAGADRLDSGEPPPAEPSDGPAMCAPDVTDCVDVVLDADPSVDCGSDGCDVGDDGVVDPSEGNSDPVWDEFPSEAASEDARNLLGLNEVDVPVDVRISRRGQEHMALTEDYVLGRLTVGLDDDGSGYRVVDVTIELPDGPATFELVPG